MSDTYRVDLTSGNVFLSNDWVYYVYKIDLVEGVFKAIVAMQLEGHDENKMYWDFAICDWFELDKLRGSLTLGYIHPDLGNEAFKKFVTNSLLLKKHSQF